MNDLHPFLGVIALTGATLTLAGVLAWAGECFSNWRETR